MAQKRTRQIRARVRMLRFRMRRPVFVVVGVIAGVDEEDVAAFDRDVVFSLPRLEVLRSVDRVITDPELL